MADTIKLTVVKEMPYRGALEEWTNSYHFLGPDPDDFGPVADALVALERAMFSNEITYKRVYCYGVHDDATRGGADLVHEISGVHGSFAPSGMGLAGASGDVAATVRWGTGDFTTGSRPKRIYLRKYYHGVFGLADPVGEQDSLAPAQKTLMEAFANSIRDADPLGIGDYCGPRGATTVGMLVSPWLTTRTLKRRGKRPPH